MLTHVPVQPGDVSEVQGEQGLSRPQVQHVVLLTEQQRGEVQEPRDREVSARPLLRIWEREEMVQRNVL